MRKRRITIGRSSTKGSNDVDVGFSSFISRQHLEIIWGYNRLKLKCHGKNGIFLNDAFKSHGAIWYDLPPKFPSTAIKVMIEQLRGFYRSFVKDVRKSMHLKTEGLFRTKRRVNKKATKDKIIKASCQDCSFDDDIPSLVASHDDFIQSSFVSPNESVFQSRSRARRKQHLAPTAKKISNFSLKELSFASLENTKECSHNGDTSESS
ncbi:unnamed protein product [Protopolystoma xenopodis]|uniref:FHA domain-containing protein n=1 Tax=Protopolystoma xenopodis TaxID=117903 RepID=A0A448XK51_9PLAT|nr:unnamed protein product [Protopolystoma xenopodis]